MVDITNDIKIFLNTKIEKTGALAAIGNFFLMPIRFLFHGKTISPRGIDSIVKVSSFQYDADDSRTKLSKQETTPKLASSNGFAGPFIILTPIFMAIFALLGLVLGIIFKGLSNFFSPEAAKAHEFVKGKLTPQNHTLGSESNPLTAETLEAQLRSHLNSAQKTKSLIIYTNSPLNANCSDLITAINPHNVILIGNKTNNLEGQLKASLPSQRKKKWEFHIQEPQDGAAPWKTTKPISNAEYAKMAYASNGPGLFEKKHKVFALTPEAVTFIKPSM